MANHTITGHNDIKLEFTRRGQSARSYRAVVGYAAPYAVFVHENVHARHPVGQAKFLETAAREGVRPMARIVDKVMKRKGGRLYDAILETAQFLLAESNKLVPVKTGFLRDSGFARVAS
jgi:hypothetical protein